MCSLEFLFLFYFFFFLTQTVEFHFKLSILKEERFIQEEDRRRHEKKISTKGSKE